MTKSEARCSYKLCSYEKKECIVSTLCKKLFSLEKLKLSYVLILAIFIVNDVQEPTFSLGVCGACPSVDNSVLILGKTPYFNGFGPSNVLIFSIVGPYKDQNQIRTF